MILTEISLDAYAICHDLRLSDLSHGLNVVYGVPGSGKTTLANYIRNTLFGFRQSAPVGHGCMEAVVNSMPCRLSRTLESNRQLFVSDVQGTRAHGGCEQAVESALRTIGEEAFDLAYCVDGRRDAGAIQAISELIQRRCHLPGGRFSAADNVAPRVPDWAGSQRQEQIARLADRIDKLERQCNRLNQRIEADELEQQRRRPHLEEDIRALANEIALLEAHTFRGEIESLDCQIADLRLQLEKATGRFTSLPAEPVALARNLSWLCQRLDETEDQIRRWTNLLNSVQAQRVALKDEMVSWKSMTIDSSDHPYHRSSEIVSSIDSGINSTEDSLSSLRKASSPDDNDFVQSMVNIAEHCGQMRVGLSELCGELSAQYTSLRHRAGAAELKRLRGCYDECQQNLDSLLKRRLQIIQQIREIDPDGAAAIEKSESEFCQFACRQGYFQARCRFVGKLADSEVPRQKSHPDTMALRTRLKQMEDQRAAVVRELVANENRLSGLKVRRQALIDETQRRSAVLATEDLLGASEQSRRELFECRREHERLVSEKAQQPQWTDRTAEMVMKLARELTGRLTCGQIRKIWLTSTASNRGPVFDVEVEDRHGHQYSSGSLPPATRQQVGLALSLAFVQLTASAGQRLPLVLDDVFLNLDPEMLQATVDVVCDFCGQGNQAIVLTADRSVVRLASQKGAAVFDLPETSVSPQETTWWSPERTTFAPPREPEFLTPFTIRQPASVSDLASGYPMVKYPPVGKLIDHAVENFESYSVYPTHGTPPRQDRCLEGSTRLDQLIIIDSVDLDRLGRLGIQRVDQLLEIDPYGMPPEFCDSHLSSSQIENWQSQIGLMQSVPVLRPAETQILLALGIRGPEQLDRTSPRQMFDRITRYLQTADGQRFHAGHLDCDQDRISQWYESLEQTRSQSQSASANANGRRYREDLAAGPRQPYSVFTQEQAVPVERPTQLERPARKDDRVARSRRQSSEAPLMASTTTAPPTPVSRLEAAAAGLKFHLDLSSELEAAPAIGPKTAERFAKINVRTVDDFLRQTAESMASRINYKRISANVILQWQHQARMVCRIPNLRGHDAQLLVACGILEPEELAAMNPEKLLEIIGPFSESKEGLKIIRGGKKPDLDEVTDWINWARQTRSLQAA